MRRRRTILLAAGLLAGVLAAGWWATDAWREQAPGIPENWSPLARLPRIQPDYGGVVIPPNIAPLNFVVQERGTAWYVLVEDAEGRSLAVHSGDGCIRFPVGPWKDLLAQNRGKQLTVDVYARNEDLVWQRFQPLEWKVAREDIDSHLIYRMMDAVYNVFKYLGIYERNLETFEERPILFNSTFGRGCVNCHTFSQNRPSPMLLHARPGGNLSIGAGLLLARGDKAERVATRTQASPKPANVIAWHPSGDLAAFSVNWYGQFMHGAGQEVREVIDLDSDLSIVDLRTGEVSADPGIANSSRLESFPCWSPDGEHLYFSSAPRLPRRTKVSPLEDYPKVKYDLMRIAYHHATKTWGKPEVLLAAATAGKSLLQPRVSPDGRHLVFCACDHGPFPAFREDSDLWLMDLTDRSYQRLAANSPRSESWHCWSSNSRWLVFSSRRDNGLVARPYFCYVAPTGQSGKAFLLPQSDPSFYDAHLKTYNLPELITGPLEVSERELLRAMYSPATDAAIMSTPEAHDPETDQVSGPSMQ